MEWMCSVLCVCVVNIGVFVALGYDKYRSCRYLCARLWGDMFLFCLGSYLGEVLDQKLGICLTFKETTTLCSEVVPSYIPSHSG